MSFFNSIFYGFISGITEILPVSSQAHQALMRYLFGVDTRIPIKRLGEGSMSFRLLPKHSKMDGRFVPVSPDEPFGYIRQLQKAHLATRDGMVGVVFAEDQKSIDSPTGQWSEPITSE